MILSPLRVKEIATQCDRGVQWKVFISLLLHDSLQLIVSSVSNERRLYL